MWGFKTEGVVLRAIHRHLLLRYDDNRSRSWTLHQSPPLETPSNHFLRFGAISSICGTVGDICNARWCLRTFGANGSLPSARRPERRPRNSLSCTTQPRDSMILFSTSGRSSMSSTMRLLFGVTRHVRWIEAKSWEEYRGVTGEVSEWSIMN